MGGVAAGPGSEWPRGVRGSRSMPAGAAGSARDLARPRPSPSHGAAGVPRHPSGAPRCVHRAAGPAREGRVSVDEVPGSGAGSHPRGGGRSGVRSRLFEHPHRSARTRRQVLLEGPHLASEGRGQRRARRAAGAGAGWTRRGRIARHRLVSESPRLGRRNPRGLPLGSASALAVAEELPARERSATGPSRSGRGRREPHGTDALPLPSLRAVRAPRAPGGAGGHAVLAALLVPTPTPAIPDQIRRVLEEHNPIEEGPAGVYADCERLSGADAEALLARLRAVPEVALAPHVDGSHVQAHIERLMQARSLA